MCAHQVEGNNVLNDWWEFEHREDTPCVEPSLDACDFYHLYPEDIKLAKSLGFNTFRFSVEWSRIEPDEGYFSRAELNHYRRVLGCIKDEGMDTNVTFHHFSTPIFATRNGTFQDPLIVDRFAKYVEATSKVLGDLIDFAVTINEPNIVAVMGYRLGMFPPGVSDKDARLEATRNLIKAHSIGFELIKSANSRTKAGLALSMSDYQAAEGGEERLEKIRGIMEDVYLENVRNNDFIGVQTYSRTRIAKSGVHIRPELNVTEMGYEIYPEALGATIRRAHSMTGLPVLVTENGISPVDDDDEIRVSFISKAVETVYKAIAEGIPVLGYTYWSLLDNFEWVLGYRPHFGLVAVDRESFARKVKPSGYFLGEIATKNEI